jgi:hypothetical protein
LFLPELYHLTSATAMFSGAPTYLVLFLFGSVQMPPCS